MNQGSSTPSPVFERCVTLDELFHAPWLDHLRHFWADDEVPMPRFVTGPHPAAIGSYGSEVVQLSLDRGEPLRPWQELCVLRLLEHDADGRLCWPEALITVGRQNGKSWLLRAIAFWWLHRGAAHFFADHPGRAATVLHVARTLSIASDVQRPARDWAMREGEPWHVRRSEGREQIQLFHPDDTMARWLVYALKSVFGQAVDVVLLDETWDIEAHDVDGAIVPTLLEAPMPQLVMFSTSNPDATDLVLARREQVLSRLRAPLDGDMLLIEWSAAPTADPSSPETWRSASPHWNETKLKVMRASHERAVDSPKPRQVEEFRANYLNIWPDRARDDTAEKDEPLLDPEVWPKLRIAAPDLSSGDITFGIEDYFGKGAAAAIALRLPDDRIFVDGLLFMNADEAVAWVGDYLFLKDRGGATITVGASLAQQDSVKRLPANIEPMTISHLPAALSTWRRLTETEQLVHDGCVELANQIAECRVSLAGHGTSIRVTSKTRTDLLRTAAWAVLAHQRIGAGDVNAW